MPKIDFLFSGHVTGAEVTSALHVASMKTVDVSNMDPGELVAKLKDGTLAISLADCLNGEYDDASVELTEYEETIE
jgi:hypothetical protein